ncbi:hypothetical protein A2V82_10105 [candidate division KSB1 bacterium RBG_16_48_16]|nr:MAG: hypothetical protein A2V82_10105 [candidate division KSB1 bacterium RBG_16_48_16]
MRYAPAFLTITVFITIFFSAASLADLTVAITSPAHKSHFARCSDINITAEASVTDGQIRRVELYQNGRLLKSDSRAPYEIAWENVPDGNYELAAKAIDDAGNEAFSDSILVIVGNAEAGNLILNGEFDCSIGPWRLDNYEGAVATFELIPNAYLTEDSTAALIEITEVGNFSWGVQLMQQFRLQQGHTYEVSFVAEAPEPKAIQITFSQDYDPWAPHWVQDITINNLATYGPYVFECAIDDPRVMFKFVIGGNKIRMYLDAVKVIDKQWTSVTSAPVQRIDHFQSLQNYPNPFNPATTIPFSLEKSGNVTLYIYNLLGETIRAFSQNHDAGRHEIKWDGLDNLGRPVTSGIYIYKLEAGDFSLLRKMLMLK